LHYRLLWRVHQEDIVEQRALGRTGLHVSALGFGCGAVGGLFVRGTEAEQRQAFDEAVAAGITYFDTAPGYGNGLSETNLGRVLAATGAPVVVGTKVRLEVSDVADAAGAVRRSVEASLRRLQRERVDLIQLHNRIGFTQDERSGQLDVADVLGPVVDALYEARAAGLADHVGFTGLGETSAVQQILASGRFETVQSYFNAVNASAGWAGSAPVGGQDFGGLIDQAAAAGIGVIVIRPLAGGALGADAPRHPYANQGGGGLVSGADFASDVRRAQAIARLARESGLESPAELSVRLAQTKPGVSTVLVGYSDREQLAAALRWTARGSLDPAVVQHVLQLSVLG
jgi:aryl-alcohol dehydrogenase-like predicted oxidoreductase